MALTVATSATGCTSALTSAYLRGMPWERPEHAAETVDAASPGDPSSAGNEADQPATTAEADDARRAAAIDEAVSRLTRMGALDESATAALVATLQSTQQEDWPVVIAEFAAALGTAASSQATRDDGETTRSIGDAAPGSVGGEAQDADVGVSALPHVVAKADLTPPEATSGPIQIDAPAPEANTSEPPSPLLVAANGPSPRHDEEAHESGIPSAPEDTIRGVKELPGDGAGRDAVLRITNACFASRVQAWGVVDRFPQDRFRAGREVIVYFELGNLTAQVTPAGHTTCIDTALELVDADGRTIHEWNFEPIAETCAGRRHDYFARYVVRLPADASPGEYRLQVRVTDTLGSTNAEGNLPLRILAAAGSDAG
jgi:hypothetical protein